MVSSLPSESNQTKLLKSVPHSFFCYSTEFPFHLLLFVRRIFFWKTVLHVDSGVDGPAPEALRLHVIYIVKKIVFFKLANTFRRAMDDDGGDDVLLDYQPQRLGPSPHQRYTHLEFCSLGSSVLPECGLTKLMVT